MRELIRHTARIALNPTQQWLDELDRTTLAANPALSDDPALVEIISRANRANLIHFAVAILRDPGGPVPANFGPEPLRMAQELLNRGLEALAADIYRIAHNVAWERWTDIAFGLTSNPQELRDLLDVAFRSSNDFIDATIAGIPAQLPLEYDALTREVSAQRRKVVEQILGGAPSTGNAPKRSWAISWIAPIPPPSFGPTSPTATTANWTRRPTRSARRSAVGHH
ncbi:putative transcriptional regulator [Mycobacterium ulcerans str. Harvey]|uniref:Transcriptional regulator n=1 Tax=Mycobacterium ulcerans str. Harvey TaxID=1299332 RepID=A0ABP3AAC2_MYCUL|nr:putative transcriptional regulator [Mycobacterium ulcerans str. Harvey]